MNTIYQSQDHIIKLPDGRKLGFRVHGDSRLPLLVYLGGLISSRIEIDYYADPRFLMVGIDRPGYGNSDINFRQTTESFASDIEHVVKFLGKSKCCIFGVSGGGSYGIGVAAEKPHLVERVGAFACITPYRTVCTKGCFIDKFPFFVENPLYTRVYMNLVKLQYMLPARLLKLLMHCLPRTSYLDVQTMDVRFIKIMTRSYCEAMKHGVNGLLSDLAFYLNKWDCSAHKKARVPIYLFHGDADKTTPLSCTIWHANQLPNCVPTYFAGEGHLHTPILHKEEMFNLLAVI